MFSVELQTLLKCNDVFVNLSYVVNIEGLELKGRMYIK